MAKRKILAKKVLGDSCVMLLYKTSSLDADADLLNITICKLISTKIYRC